MQLTGLKKTLYWSMTLDPVNDFLKAVLKPISQKLPIQFLERIPVKGPLEIDIRGQKLLRLETDGGDVVAGMIYWLGLDGFEGASMRVFHNLLAHSRTVIDIGANTGIYALLAGLDNENRDVYAFEPMPNVFNGLQVNIAKNNLSNVHGIQSAVTNFSGHTKFYTYDSVRLPYISSTKKIHSGSREIDVAATTLDSFVTRNNISNIDLIKIDTEGTEHLVLEGAQQMLHDNVPMIICEVLTGAMTEEGLQASLAPHNYKYFLITSTGLQQQSKIIGDHANGNFNYLFVPESKLMLIEGNQW